MGLDLYGIMDSWGGGIEYFIFYLKITRVIYIQLF